MPIPPSLLGSTEGPTAASAAHAPPVRPTPSTGPILVATRGEAESDAAVRLAWRLAGRTGADVQVLTALEPIAPIDVQFAVMPPPPGELLAAERDEQLGRVNAQLCRGAPSGCDWPVAAAEGPADVAIARVATEEAARVVLTGRGRHGALGRVVSGETVLRLLRRTDAPVYAVEPEVAGLARRVVVAMDFSPYSVHAARVALGLIATDAVVTLAHVIPPAATLASGSGAWMHAYEQAIPELFARVRQELAAPEDVLVETAILTGRSPGRAIAGFATALKADLVVSATHGHAFLARLLLGSVASELFRGAPCSFLCVPGSAVAHAAAREREAAQLLRESVPSTGWEWMVRQLSERHAGHPSTLALADATTGQRGEVGPLPLAALTYTPDGRSVQCDFGTTDAGPPRLTYVVRDVTAIDRLVDAGGTTRAVRVLGADGEVLLRFV